MELTLFVDDPTARALHDVPRVDLPAAGRHVDGALHDDGGAVDVGAEGEARVVDHVGQPHAHLRLGAAVTDEAPHVDLAALPGLARPPLGHPGVAAERQHHGLEIHRARLVSRKISLSMYSNE